ncbi:MAG: hypothetical protein MK212_15025 [Saprospiraceae bacterium]|nr:hypothetical protein [Saprospiraceae bacterium]
MKKRNTLLGLLLGLLLITTTSFAQNILTMEFEGDQVTATQEIPEKFLGRYIQDSKTEKVQFAISTEQGESFLLKQVAINDQFPGWNPDRKKVIEWGVMTENGEIALFSLSEFRNGSLVNYEAMILLIRDLTTDKYSYHNIYERDGQLYIDHAIKVEETAGTTP